MGTAPRSRFDADHTGQPLPAAGPVRAGAARVGAWFPRAQGATMTSPNPAPISHPALQTRRPTWSRLQRTGAALTMALALVAGGIAVATPAAADQIGQAPTTANITGNGSFTVSSSTITGQS